MRAKTIFFLLLVLGINLFFRLQTAKLPFTKIEATNAVYKELTQEALNYTEERFKNLNPQLRQELAIDLLEAWQKERKKFIQARIKEKAIELQKDYRDKEGNVFLFEIDPYHWLRLTRNFVSTGRIGTQLKNGQEYDTYMLAPQGMPVEVSLHKNLHVYLSGYIYKICQRINKNISLEKVVFFIPAWVSLLAVASIFLFCLSIGQGITSAFFAALSLGLAPIFLGRSIAGWFDTDPYIILFSILAVWGFFILATQKRNLKESFTIIFFTGVSVGLFAFTWDGWWYILALIIISSFYYLINLWLLKKEGLETLGLIKNTAFSLFAVLSVSLLFALLFAGYQAAARIFSGPQAVFSALRPAFWPNTFLTVSELAQAQPIEIIMNIGGELIFLFSVVYLLAILLYKKAADYLKRSLLAILFTFWILLIYLAATKAKRFSLLLTIPVSVCFGFCVEAIIKYITIFSNRYLAGRIKKYVPFFKGIVFILVVLLFLKTASFTKGMYPLINSEWQEVLQEINLRTPKDAIINSWWDYGHWFKAIAQRPVIFDGATQNTPMAYWMGRVLLSQDEEEAVGILRMLNSGSNLAFEKLRNQGFSDIDCVQILNKLFKMKKPQAELFLKDYVLDKDAREDILKHLFLPHPVYFIVEDSLLAKMPAISFLGGWDFVRADIYRIFKKAQNKDCLKYMREKYAYSAEEAQRTYETLRVLKKKDILSWISGRLYFYSHSADYRQDGNTLFFNNGYTVNLDTYSVQFYNRLNNLWQTPQGIFYVKDGQIKEQKFSDAQLPYWLFFINEGLDKRLVVLDKDLAKSIFTRLYFLKGKGLRHFKLFIEKELPKKNRILVFEVIFDE